MTKMSKERGIVDSESVKKGRGIILNEDIKLKAEITSLSGRLGKSL